MPYAEGRIYNDADSHIMETRGWLASYADPGLRDRIPPPDFARTGRMAEALDRKHDAAYWASINLEENLVLSYRRAFTVILANKISADVRLYLNVHETVQSSDPRPRKRGVALTDPDGVHGNRF